MVLKKSQADLEYRKILSQPNRTESVIQFLRTEANCLINLKYLLDQCGDDTSYNFNLPLMEESAKHVRTTRLLLIEKQFRFFDIKKKHYFKKLLDYLNLN